MAVALWWLRRDLRLSDNPALLAALAEGQAVLPVFIWAPDEEAPWAPGGASRWWLHESLRALTAALATHGARLILRQGPTLATLRELVAETGAQAVHWNRLYDPALTARDTAIKAALSADGLTARSHASALLHEPWEIAGGAGQPMKVFTPYWKRCLARGEPARPLAAPTTWATPAAWPHSLPLDALGLAPTPDWAAGLRATWTPGEAGAQARLAAFLADGLADYSSQRDYPAVAGVSGLSPHLHFGECTPRQVWQAVRGHGAGTLGEPFLRQLGWREFAHHLLYHFPQTPSAPLRPEYAAFPWAPDPGKRLLRAWQKGRTGYPLVDAGMRQLWVTGTMHNRVRMVVASFLVKDLRLSWEHGARWFWDTLVDANLANNTLGWQWAAGCGADAAPYFRIFNPVTQSRKFDPAGAYLRQWLPALAKLDDESLHAPWEAPANLRRRAGLRLGHEYPAPLVDHATARDAALTALAQLKAPPEQP